MIQYSRVIEALWQELDDIRTRESEELADIDDPNCYGAGHCSGAIAAVDTVIAFLRERCGETWQSSRSTPTGDRADG